MSSGLDQEIKPPTGAVPETPRFARLARNNKNRVNLRYGLAILGGIALIVGSFLPWIAVHYSLVNQDINISGWGDIYSSTSLPNLNQLPDLGLGLYSVILGVGAVIIGLVALLRNRIELAAIVTAYGLFCVALMVDGLADVISKLGKVKQLTATLLIINNNELKTSPPVNVTIGYGLILGLLGAFLVIMGGLVPMAFKQKKRRP